MPPPRSRLDRDDRAHALEGPGRSDERRRHALRAVEHARRSGVAQTEAWAREQVVHDAMEAADLETVEAQAHAIDLLAEEHPLVWPERVRTMLQMHRGDLPAAERALQRALTRHPDGGAYVCQYIGGPLMWLRYEQGRLAEILPLLRRFVAGGNESPVWRAALARAELEAGDREVSRNEYLGLAASGFREVDADFVAPITLAHLTLCRRFGRAEDAAWLAERLAPPIAAGSSSRPARLSRWVLPISCSDSWRRSAAALPKRARTSRRHVHSANAWGPRRRRHAASATFSSSNRRRKPEPHTRDPVVAPTPSPSARRAQQTGPRRGSPREFPRASYPDPNVERSLNFLCSARG